MLGFHQLRDFHVHGWHAFPLPPNSHGLERTGLHCQCCGREIVLSVQGVFAYAPRGSARRFCDPACRQAAYRRRVASVEENTPPSDKVDGDDNSTPHPHQVGPNQTVTLGPSRVDTATYPIGRPCRVATRCRRRPQKKREWLAQ